MAKLTNAQLITAIEHAERLAEQAGEVTEERIAALRAYLGENVNPAPDGRSQVVSRDVYDIVESIKPPILRIFLSGEKVVEFTPRRSEDIQAAEQETGFVNHVILEKNDGFSVLHDWLHDGLLSKTGYVLAHWDESEDTTIERYEGLSDEEFAMLAQDPEIEISEYAAMPDAYGGNSHTVALKRTATYGCVKLIPVAPERVLVSAQHDKTSLKDCDFVERREWKTLSQLRLEGFKVEDDLNDGGSSENDYESDVRDRDNPWRDREDAGESDPSMRRVKVREVWMRLDYAGKGVAELRHIVAVGTTILLNEEADMCPVAAFAPFPLPHQHYGQSVYDIAHDIQDIKTALQRGVLDATYLSAAPRFGVDVQRVNLDDMLVSRPGGLVRVEGDPSGALFPLTSPQTAGASLPVIEYMDAVRETRTGITRYTQGLDANSLNKTASGIMQIMGASQARIELIARQFAESVKDLFSIVHAQTLKHARKPQITRLNNEFVAVDPRQWVKRSDMSISVGLGNGNKLEQQQFLMQMLQIALGPAIPLGLTDPPKVKAMLDKLTNLAGFKSGDLFWSVPQPPDPNQPPPPPPPDPKMVEVQQRGQLEQQKAQMEMQAGAQKAQADMALEQQRAAAQMDLERQRMQQDAELARYKAELDAQSKVEVARIMAAANMQTAAMRPGVNDGTA
jgi:hypothetical protein